jgi:hypothetical protein
MEGIKYDVLLVQASKTSYFIPPISYLTLIFIIHYHVFKKILKKNLHSKNICSTFAPFF